MRHGGRAMVEHAALVAALALRAAAIIGVHPDLLQPLARAALLHDVGELYLSPGLFSSTDPRERAQMRQIQTHPILGAQVDMPLDHLRAACDLYMTMPEVEQEAPRAKGCP